MKRASPESGLCLSNCMSGEVRGFEQAADLRFGEVHHKKDGCAFFSSGSWVSLGTVLHIMVILFETFLSV